MTAESFRFAYEPGVLRVGEGAVADLEAEVAATGNERALVVCGQTVGSTPAVVDPVREGLGDRLAGVFDETTPKKRLWTAIRGAERLAAADADAVVALGGGSSLDVAKAIAVVAATEQDAGALGATFERTGTLPAPDALPGLVVVPTTLAGADLSQSAGLTATSSNGLVETDVNGGLGDPGLLPDALVYDPALFATTPRSILAGSAMNGFDKGIETLYARNATPVTDGTAMRGLALLRDALPTLADDDPAMANIVRGIVLVQYGISRPDGLTLSVIHAFGHGLTAHSTVQQGVAHAVVAPHTLAYLFEHVDGRRALLADALGVDTGGSAQAVADGVIDAVEAVRDTLGLPVRFRDIDAVERSMLDAMAETTAEDSLLENAPAGLEPTVEELRGVLQEAW
ncbi:MAG: iron-containing alcohol dehydrogenase family protein [Halovenus sp.]